MYASMLMEGLRSGTAMVVADIAEGRFAEQKPIPMAEILSTIGYAMALSPLNHAAEINLTQSRR